MSEQNLDERLRDNPRPVVIDFWAPWCGPCRAIEPLLKQAEAQYAGKVDVWKINADENPELLRGLRIYGIPTLVCFKDGQEIARQVGVPSPQALTNLFEAAQSGEKPVKAEPTSFDRFLRLAAGSLMIWLAYNGGFAGLYVLLALLGAGVAFSGVHDRCPVWQAIRPKLAALIRRGSTENPA